MSEKSESKENEVSDSGGIEAMKPATVGGMASIKKEVEQEVNNFIITELTPEQEASMPGFVEKYVAIGIKTGPIDKEKAKVYAKKLYKFLERNEPKVIFTDGPTQAWLATVWINHCQQNDIPIPEKVEDIVFDWETIQKIASGISFVWPYLDGQMMTSWVAWVKFMQSIGVKVSDSFSLIEDQIEFNVIYPLNDYCIFSERFSEVHMKDDVLNCDGGPSIAYPDGTRCWSLNGIAVPQWLAETPADEIDCNEYAKITNAEIRREFMRKVGITTYCEKMGSEVIDKQGDYELHVIDLGGTTGKRHYLKMLNPSIKVWHMECVSRDCQTVDDALYFRNKTKRTPLILT